MLLYGLCQCLMGSELTECLIVALLSTNHLYAHSFDLQIALSRRFSQKENIKKC